jgi:hypothetical protein
LRVTARSVKVREYPKKTKSDGSNDCDIDSFFSFFFFFLFASVNPIPPTISPGFVATDATAGTSTVRISSNAVLLNARGCCYLRLNMLDLALGDFSACIAACAEAGFLTVVELGDDAGCSVWPPPPGTPACVPA